MGLFGIHSHTWAWIIGGFFAFLAIVTSFYEIYRHVHYDHHKYIRRYIIRILLMVPVYAIESWFGILYPSSSVYLNAIRDFYEAVTVYSFYQLLVNSLGGFHEVSASLQQSNDKQEFPHMFPFKCCCKPWKFIENDFNFVHRNSNDMKEEFLLRKKSSVFHYRNPRSNPFFRNCTIGVLQYCFCQIFSCIIIFILQVCDVYGDGEYKLTVGFPYFVILLTLSQTWAIYCLVLFYYSIKNIHTNTDSVYVRFIQMKPILKFVCIKAVVFFTYWQSIGIAFLVFINIIHDEMMNSLLTADDIANSLQDFIICIEMFCFAIAHHYAFNPLHFRFGNDDAVVDDNELVMMSSAVSAQKVGKAVFDAVNVTDIARNAKDVVDLKHSKAIQVLNTITMDHKKNSGSDVNLVKLKEDGCEIDNETDNRIHDRISDQ